MAGSLVALAAAAPAMAQVTFVQKVGSYSRPIYVTAPGGDFSRIFVIEQFATGPVGRIKIFRPATSTSTDFLVLSGISNGDEQGLLGLAFHPDYATNRKFYINFTNTSGTTVIREYTTLANNPDAADTASARTILTIAQPQANHNGGWIGFGPDGMLYIASGDGGGANDEGSGHTTGTGNAQDITSNLLGKMLRIDVNGDDFPADANRNYRIPAGNPFIGVTGDDEIWSYGLRNPWRNSFDRLTNDLWIADVGQNVWEEINREPANTPGRNYGWRCMEGNNCTGLTGCTCNAGSLTMPVYVYQHASSRCSVTGGYVYRGCLNPALYGHYIFADYCTGEIWGRNPDTGVVTRLVTLGFGVTSFGEDAYGELWVTRQTGGRVLRMEPAAGAPAFTDCNGNNRPDCWDLADGTATDNNGNGIPDSCDPPCGPDFNGDGFLDFFDYDAYVECFELSTCPPGKSADFNGDDFVDFFDYDAFVAAFETGC
ncbi:MAG: PQQ-dependent sugar dehydrogenase [Tepidisphaera sp.]